MASSSMYTVVDRTDDGNTSNRKRESATRSQASSGAGANATSIRRSLAVVHSADEVKSDGGYSSISNDYETITYRENILFVFLDIYSQLTSHSVALLRAINNDVRTYTDSFTCLDSVRSLHDRIFFISSSADKQLIEEFHHLHSIEVIFILNFEAQIDSRLPKLYGVYTHLEELLMALKDTLEWYEQTQMELIIFEHDRIFLWTQLWREEYLTSRKSKGSTNKEKLVHVAENYYQGNTKQHQSIKEFEQNYNPNDPLQWCFSSPFPSHFLRYALRSQNTEHLHACRFLLNDVSRAIQQKSDRKSSCELYKGMKMTSAFLDKLENHFGELICSQGFFICSQSRKTALETASSLDHRPDLMPVLFKINYDKSVPLAELPNKDTTSFVVFDVFTVFRVKYVNRGQVSIVKIELADEDGRRLAREYRAKYASENVQNLLDQILFPPKPPARLPPLRKSPVPESPLQESPASESPLQESPASESPALRRPPDLSTNEVRLSLMSEAEDDQIHAENLVKRGDIDQAITIYQRLKADPHILTIIGNLYAEQKGDYNSAVNYYKQALKLQEKKGEDVTNTLSRLGILHQNRREFDMSLACHSRALRKLKKASPINQTSIASILIGMANAYWGQKNLTEALNHAQQALALNQSIESGNEPNIAANLAVLANIHYNSGDTKKALEMATQALGILERSESPDSLPFATLLNNVATIQVANGLLTDARQNFERALEICRKSFPDGHPTRTATENNVRRIIAMGEKPDESNA